MNSISLRVSFGHFLPVVCFHSFQQAIKLFISSLATKSENSIQLVNRLQVLARLAAKSNQKTAIFLFLVPKPRWSLCSFSFASTCAQKVLRCAADHIADFACHETVDGILCSWSSFRNETSTFWQRGVLSFEGEEIKSEIAGPE